MKLTDALLGEHGAIYALFDHTESALADAGTLADVQLITASLSAVLAGHATIENDVLFPALEEVVGPDGPLAVMRREHDDVDRLLKEIESAGELEEAADYLRTLIALARDHFTKEEQVLFGMAQQALGDDKLEEMGRKWSEARKVFTF